jgi:hypothetical protein
MGSTGGRARGKAGGRVSKGAGAGGSRGAKRALTTTLKAADDPESFEVLGEGD